MTKNNDTTPPASTNERRYTSHELQGPPTNQNVGKSDGVAVLVVSYFSVERIEGLLADLAQQDIHKKMIVSIVDNSVDAHESASLTELVSLFESRFEALQLTISSKNLGYAGGNNLAYRAVSDHDFDVLFVVNPDIRLLDGRIDSAVRVIRDGSSAVAVPQTRAGNRILDGRGAINLWTGKSRQLEPHEELSDHWLVYPGGHFLGTSRRLWDRLAGMSEDFFLYDEEADFVLRGGLHRSNIRSISNFIVKHDSGATTGSMDGIKSTTTMYHASRSSVVLFQKHSSIRRRLPIVIAARLCQSVTVTMRGGNGGRIIAGTMSGLRRPRKSRTLGSRG